MKADEEDKVKIKAEDVYGINPEDLEGGFLDVSKLFFRLAGSTADAYIAFLLAKNEVKRIAAKIFLEVIKDPNLAKAPSAALTEREVEVHPDVMKAKQTLIDKALVWERNKAAKDSLITKKEMLSAISYNRKTDREIEKSVS